jgi:stage III sporulation protein AB
MYRTRPQQIAQVAQAIRLLRQDIEFGQIPLISAVQRVGESMPPPVSQVFREIVDGLANRWTAEEAFHRAARHVGESTAMNAADFEPLLAIGSVVGTSDRSHLSMEIDAALIRLQGREAEAVEAQRKNERLWQYLGILTGLLLILVMW